ARQCLSAIQFARSLHRMFSGPRRTGVACPSCHKGAPIGPHWRCDSCGAAFDIFDPAAGAVAEPVGIATLNLSAGSAATAAAETDGSQCPACYADAATARCLHCHAVALVSDWNPTAVISSSPSGTPGVTRLRPPRIPSVATIVLGVCAAIVALMVIFFAIFAYTASSRQFD